MPSPESLLSSHLATLSSDGQPFGLLFDCDGTLIDTMPGYHRSWELTLEELKLPPLPPARFYSFGGMPVPDIFQLLLDEAGNTQISLSLCESTKRKHHAALAEAGTAPAPGIACVIEIAKKYKAMGVPIAVASSGWRDHVLENLERNGCADLFDAVVTADDPQLKNGKPAPDIFLLAASRLGVLPERCVGFEDAPLGMQSLTAAGVRYACDVTEFWEYPRRREEREAAEREGA